MPRNQGNPCRCGWVFGAIQKWHCVSSTGQRTAQWSRPLNSVQLCSSLLICHIPGTHTSMRQCANTVCSSLVLTLGAVVDGPDAPILVTELMDQCLSTQLQVVKPSLTMSMFASLTHTNCFQTKNSAGPTMSTVVKQARQIALGVRYLHSKNLTHGNISLSKVGFAIQHLQP